MHDRRVLGVAFAVFIAVALAVVIWSSRPVHCPLVLNIVSGEPAGIDDDTGQEMWLATLSLSNSDAGPPSPQHSVYFKNGGKGIEVKVGTHWIEVDAVLDLALAPGQKHEILLLVPAGTEACRIRLKYTGSRLVNGRLLWIAERLPQFVRFRMSYKFWRWVGLTRYGPNSHWRDVILELPLPSTSGRPGSISDERMIRLDKRILVEDSSRAHALWSRAG
jgi:hypothetical protein